jgi:hypothetical protein
MAGKIHEFLFPRSYLIDYVEERPPFNGKVTGIFKEGICDKAISSDSITQRMLLITSNIKTVEFTFGQNAWVKNTGSYLGFMQLLSFRLNGSEVVSNFAKTDGDFQRLSVTLDEYQPFFSSIKVQCVLSLEKNPSNVKHICYLEITAQNSKATLDGKPLPYNNGVWSIGNPKDPTENKKLGDDDLYVFDVEEVKGPLVFTGVGVDTYAGFVFQIARINDPKKSKYLIDECFYEDVPRLKAADITHYHYFESDRVDQTGYKESGHSTTHKVRNLFRELALEDKEVAILLQKLNHFDSEFITNPVSNVLPSMLDILQRCFADNQMSLIQSVIRVNHIKSDDSMINPPVRQIWTTFADTISLVKKYVRLRPSLNLIECAFLSEYPRDKRFAIIVAILQCLTALILAWNVFFRNVMIAVNVTSYPSQQNNL